MPIECSQHGITAVPRFSRVPVDAAGGVPAGEIATGNAAGTGAGVPNGSGSGSCAGADIGEPGRDSRQARFTRALVQAPDASPLPVDMPFHRGPRRFARGFFAHALPQPGPRLDPVAVRDDPPASTSTDCFHSRGTRP